MVTLPVNHNYTSHSDFFASRWVKLESESEVSEYNEQLQSDEFHLGGQVELGWNLVTTTEHGIIIEYEGDVKAYLEGLLGTLPSNGYESQLPS